MIDEGSVDSVQVPCAESLEKAVHQEDSLIKIRMNDDLRKLRSVRSRKLSRSMKAEYLEFYRDYCQMALNRAEPKHDTVLNLLCIWYFDIEDFTVGLRLAEKVLSSYLVKPCGYRHTHSPEGFKRNMAEILADILSDHVVKSRNPAAHSEQLTRLMELTRSHDMNDHISARMHRAYAMSLEAEDAEQAIYHYRESYALRRLSGVLKRIERLTKLLSERQGEKV